MVHTFTAPPAGSPSLAASAGGWGRRLYFLIPKKVLGAQGCQCRRESGLPGQGTPEKRPAACPLGMGVTVPFLAGVRVPLPSRDSAPGASWGARQAWELGRWSQRNAGLPVPGRPPLSPLGPARAASGTPRVDPAEHGGGREGHSSPHLYPPDNAARRPPTSLRSQPGQHPSDQ